MLLVIVCRKERECSELKLSYLLRLCWSCFSEVLQQVVDRQCSSYHVIEILVALCQSRFSPPLQLKEGVLPYRVAPMRGELHHLRGEQRCCCLAREAGSSRSAIHRGNRFTTP